MELIFNKLVIVDESNKVAKIQSFKKGINVVTSIQPTGRGNYFGKSTLLKSLYYALGADVEFPKDHGWEGNSKYFYLLTFYLDDSLYKILRFGSYFAIYDLQNKKIFETNHRNKLAKFFAEELFRYPIVLKDRNSGKYEQANPFAYYVLNFVEQYHYRGCEFDSFLNVRQYDKPFIDLICAHLGLDSKRLEELETRIFENQKLVSEADYQIKICQQIVSSLENEYPATFEGLDSVKKELEQYEKQYRDAAEKYNQCKKILFKLIQDKTVFSLELSQLQETIRTNEKEGKMSLKQHKCPLCQNNIENYDSIYFKKSLANQNLKEQLISFTELVTDLDEKINDQKEKYAELQKSVKEFEERVGVASGDYKKMIEAIGLRDYKETVIGKSYEASRKKENLQKSIDADKKEQSKLKSTVKRLNSDYSKVFNDMVKAYGFEAIHPGEYSIAEKIKSGDPRILTVVWLLTLNKVKREHGLKLYFPLVLDNPNDRDLAPKTEKSLFQMIFDSSSFNEQIIVSSVDLNPHDYPTVSINEISLSGGTFHLLTKDDYEDASKELNRVLDSY